MAHLKDSEVNGNLHVSEDIQIGDISVAEKFGKLSVDYIVEQGIDGNWTYRKWNSGIAECWGKHTIKSLDCGANHYSGFYYSKGTSISFPTELFSETPVVCFDGGSQNYINFIRDFGSSKTDAYFLVAGLISGINNVNLQIQAKGRWK